MGVVFTTRRWTVSMWPEISREGMNIYYDPDEFDSEIVMEISEDEPYQFDIIAVWRDLPSGWLYWGRDSGCSCPSPFEDIRHINELTPLSMLTFDSLILEVSKLEVPSDQKFRFIAEAARAIRSTY